LLLLSRGARFCDHAEIDRPADQQAVSSATPSPSAGVQDACAVRPRFLFSRCTPLRSPGPLKPTRTLPLQWKGTSLITPLFPPSSNREERTHKTWSLFVRIFYFQKASFYRRA